MDVEDRHVECVRAIAESDVFLEHGFGDRIMVQILELCLHIRLARKGERESERNGDENVDLGDVGHLEVLYKYLNVGEVRGHGECVSEIFGVEGLDNQHSNSWRMD